MKDERDIAQGHSFTFLSEINERKRFPTDCVDRSIGPVYLATIPAYILFQIVKRSTLEVIDEKE